MRNPAKAILVAILIAIPAPFVLGLLLTTTPEPLKILAMGQGLEALGSQGGIAAYLFAFVVFAVAAFVAIATRRQAACRQELSRAQSSTSQCPAQQSV